MQENIWDAISFKGYMKKTLFGQKPATPQEIEQMIQNYCKASKKCVEKCERNMERTLRKYSSAPDQQAALNAFFAQIRNSQAVYENERMEILREVANNKNADCRIVHVPLVGYVLRMDAMGDNCYEYALKDYYETKLMEKAGGVFGGMMTIADPLRIRREFPLFLHPGFTNDWPLFKENNDEWEKLYRERMFTRNGLDAGIRCDALKFGLSCERVEYEREWYCPKPGKTLIYCILGEYIDSMYGVAERDYHFFRYHPDVGLWSHKMGFAAVTCFDLRDELIFDPRLCKTAYNRGVTPVGFYEIGIP